MSKGHTPGPWRGGVLRENAKLAAEVAAEFEKHRGATTGVISTEDGRFIAMLGTTPGTVEEDAANARLIAAAPELLEAIEALGEALGVVTVPKGHPLLSAAEKSRAAIAKATGSPNPLPNPDNQMPGGRVK